jgi:hypothetical protein
VLSEAIKGLSFATDGINFFRFLICALLAAMEVGGRVVVGSLQNQPVTYAGWTINVYHIFVNV